MTALSKNIVPVEKPVQKPAPRFGVGLSLVQVDNLIRASEARALFSVSGDGLCVAVVDTGLNAQHVDFASRVPMQVNLTSDNGGDEANADDNNGHGTNVGGIIVANADHVGVAPSARIVPIKVLDAGGNGSFEAVDSALGWVLDNHRTHHISVVCMSLGGPQNFTEDEFLEGDTIRAKIRELRDNQVAVVVAAGNDFFTHDSAQGMSYPAIIRECVSVGAVYDDAEGSFGYSSGAVAYSTAPDRITPFSQRLHPTANDACFTDIFAPGAPVTSSGTQGPHGESTQHGTSQATPVICGVLLLMQEFHKRVTGELPEVGRLTSWMRSAGVAIHDGDDEQDNVDNTNETYLRLDAVRSLGAIQRDVEISELRSSGIIAEPRHN